MPEWNIGNKVYSTDLICVIKIGQELGYYKCVTERDWICFYTNHDVHGKHKFCNCYLFEINAMPKSFIATMTRACGLAPNKMIFFDFFD